LDEHKAVVDALLAGDAVLACKKLTAHYDKTAQIILNSGATEA
jgi:DNA-binding GntR family transcriptional regulator